MMKMEKEKLIFIIPIATIVLIILERIHLN